MGTAKARASFLVFQMAAPGKSRARSEEITSDSAVSTEFRTGS
jgi:hypothetical protein